MTLLTGLSFQVTSGEEIKVMKKLILILTAVAGLLVAGCNQGGSSNQGGTSDQYNTNAGHSKSLGGTNNAHP